jgi:hypothetical protein
LHTVSAQALAALLSSPPVSAQVSAFCRVCTASLCDGNSGEIARSLQRMTAAKTTHRSNSGTIFTGVCSILTLSHPISFPHSLHLIGSYANIVKQ